MAGPNAAPVAITLLSDTEIKVVRTVKAPRRLVFDCWTKPVHIQKWLLGPPGWTMPICEVDLRVGGKWRYGWRMDNGTEMLMEGEYKEIAPPERLVSTERWGAPWPETLNTLLLSEQDGVTTVTIKVLYPTKDARDAALKTPMKEGMCASFTKLEALLATLA